MKKKKRKISFKIIRKLTLLKILRSESILFSLSYDKNFYLADKLCSTFVSKIMKMFKKYK